MTVATPINEQRFLLYLADWEQYRSLRQSLDERGQRAFLTYDGHTLELTSPSREHDKSSELLGLLVRVIARVTKQELESGGSTTFKRRDLERGLEPDLCFWIRNHAQVRGVDDIDLQIHPPPDLAIEIEISRRLLDRKGIYAKLGVPEVWRYDGKSFRILVLNDERRYRASDRSVAFPAVNFTEIEELLDRWFTVGELEWEDVARKWVRRRLER